MKRTYIIVSFSLVFDVYPLTLVATIDRFSDHLLKLRIVGFIRNISFFFLLIFFYSSFLHTKMVYRDQITVKVNQFNAG